MPARVLHAIVSLFAETARGWSRRNPDLLSAALAFNTLFSLAPLLLLFITIVGEQYRSQVIGQIIVAVDRWGGPAIAGLVADLLAGMQRAIRRPARDDRHRRHPGMGRFRHGAAPAFRAQHDVGSRPRRSAKRQAGCPGDANRPADLDGDPPGDRLRPPGPVDPQHARHDPVLDSASESDPQAR